MEKTIIIMASTTIGIIIVAIVFIFLYKKYFKLSLQKKEECQQLQTEIYALSATKNTLDSYINTGNNTINDIHNKINDAEKCLKDLNHQYDIIKNHLNDMQQVSKNNEIKLQQEYENAVQEYQDKLKYIKKSCEEEKALIESDLNSLKQTRHTAIELWRKQEQDKNQLDGYKLNITAQDKKDIQLLQNIQLQFSHPRVISKLIWQTYFQPLAKQQFIMILGSTTKCGIYKITNIMNNKCYIGQSVDIYKRWCDHCKCGCGMDTPKNNQLYIAMQQDGIENFTFELLEECSREELNKKEAFYINLYESNYYGYNQTQGNN